MDALEALGFTKVVRGGMDVVYTRLVPYSWFDYDVIVFEYYFKRIRLDMKSTHMYVTSDVLDAVYLLRKEYFDQ